MKNDIIVSFGKEDLVSSLRITTSGMRCDIHINTYWHISASVEAPQTAFEIDLYRLPHENDLYWLEVMPFGFASAISIFGYGFPEDKFTQTITDAYSRTMVAEAVAVLAIVMGCTRSDLGDLFGVEK